MRLKANDLFLAFVWLLAAGALGVVVGGQNLPELWALRARGIRTTGVVLAKEPSNHQLVRYSFNAAGQAARGAGSAGIGTAGFDSLKIGDQIPVTYDPVDPTSSVIGDIEDQLRNEAISVGAAMLLIPTMIVWLLISHNKFGGRGY